MEARHHSVHAIPIPGVAQEDQHPVGFEYQVAIRQQANAGGDPVQPANRIPLAHDHLGNRAPRTELVAASVP